MEGGGGESGAYGKREREEVLGSLDEELFASDIELDCTHEPQSGCQRTGFRAARVE